MRGGGFRSRLKAAGAAGAALIGDITNKDSKDCHVSAMLTDDDRKELLGIKPEGPARKGLAYPP